METIPLFVARLAEHWIALMSGIISLLVMFVEKEGTRRSLSRWGLRLFSLMCFMAAAYLTWLDQWREARALEAPRLSIVGEGEVVLIPQKDRASDNDAVALLKVEFKNAGLRPTRALSLMISVGVPEWWTITFPRIADEIQPGESIHLALRIHKLPRTAGLTFASIVASYEDPLKPGGGGLTQCFYRKWPSIQEGQSRAVFEPAEVGEASVVWHGSPATRMACPDPEMINPSAYAKVIAPARPASPAAKPLSSPAEVPR